MANKYDDYYIELTAAQKTALTGKNITMLTPVSGASAGKTVVPLVGSGIDFRTLKSKPTIKTLLAGQSLKIVKILPTEF